MPVIKINTVINASGKIKYITTHKNLHLQHKKEFQSSPFKHKINNPCGKSPTKQKICTKFSHTGSKLSEEFLQIRNFSAPFHVGLLRSVRNL